MGSGRGRTAGRLKARDASPGSRRRRRSPHETGAAAAFGPRAAQPDERLDYPCAVRYRRDRPPFAPAAAPTIDRDER